MSPEFAAALNAKLQAYHSWAVGKPTVSGRLVKYEGVDFASAIDVPADELRDEVEGFFRQGYCVDWSEYLGKIYLVVWEGNGGSPPWQLIYQEKDLV